MLRRWRIDLPRRLTELHHRVRRDVTVGLCARQGVGQPAAIECQGIRPAMGYPASPDHTEKDLLWGPAGRGEQHRIWLAGVKGDGADTRRSAVWHIAHLEALLFRGEGRTPIVTRSKDYARRQGAPPVEAQRWLGPQPGHHEPEARVSHP